MWEGEKGREKRRGGREGKRKGGGGERKRGGEEKTEWAGGRGRAGPEEKKRMAPLSMFRHFSGTSVSLEHGVSRRHICLFPAVTALPPGEVPGLRRLFPGGSGGREVESVLWPKRHFHPLSRRRN